MLLFEGGPLLLQLRQGDPVFGLVDPQFLEPHACPGYPHLLPGAEQVERFGVPVLQGGKHRCLDVAGLAGELAGVLDQRRVPVRGCRGGAVAGQHELAVGADHGQPGLLVGGGGVGL